MKDKTKKTKVVNLRNFSFPYNACDMFIGRGSVWGNPFRISKRMSREMVITKHKEWLLSWINEKREIIIDGYSNKVVVERLEELRGKTLGCYCKPLACHGDVLVAILEQRL